jgi:hypothetical protein
MVPPLTDKSLFPFGKYKGTALAHVPATHLLWCFDNMQLRADLKKYIEDNKFVLEKEVKRSRQNNRR